MALCNLRLLRPDTIASGAHVADKWGDQCDRPSWRLKFRWGSSRECGIFLHQLSSDIRLPRVNAQFSTILNFWPFWRLRRLATLWNRNIIELVYDRWKLCVRFFLKVMTLCVAISGFSSLPGPTAPNFLTKKSVKSIMPWHSFRIDFGAVIPLSSSMNCGNNDMSVNPLVFRSALFVLLTLRAINYPLYLAHPRWK